MVGNLIKAGKEKSLGVAREKRRYDLPLNKSAGTRFLITLIALMSFLAILALAASFALSAMTDRWSTGLENKMTVEIPAENAEGTILPRADVKALTDKTAALLGKHPAVKSVHILTDEELHDLVKPWLGDDLMLGRIPLPGLIALETHDSTPQTLDILQEQVRKLNGTTRIDTHEQWLTDLLRFTGALQFAAALLTIIIGLTTLTAIAGAVRSRMAVHDAEIELLHLMGASDHYIARQFQRHSLILALQGSLIGVAVGGLTLMIIGWIAGEMGVNLLPDFSLNSGQIFMLMTIPLLTALIAIIAARKTVISVLETMP